MQSQGVFKELLSPLHLGACCTRDEVAHSWERCCDSICSGGIVSRALNFILDYGLVTGSDAVWAPDGTITPGIPGQSSGCVSYNTDGDALAHFSSAIMNNHECPSQCDNGGHEISFENDIRGNEPKATRVVINGANKVEVAQDFILHHGSLVMIFEVYPEFLAYTTGVFTRFSNEKTGLHAVKVIGWGTDSDTGLDYWLCVNSWGNKWGESGLFKIKRGSNESNCENWGFTGILYECDAGQVVNEFGRCEDLQSVFFINFHISYILCTWWSI